MRSNIRKLEIVCFLLMSFFLKVSAPAWKSMPIMDLSPIQPYMKLVFAIGMVETKGDTLAYNPLEEAVGYFQIRPVRLIDYNIRTGSTYTMNDLYNFKTSERIFLYFADQVGPYNFEQIARKWNGSGQLTNFYWERIKKYL